jgi:hypothetical protein
LNFSAAFLAEVRRMIGVEHVIYPYVNSQLPGTKKGWIAPPLLLEAKAQG